MMKKKWPFLEMLPEKDVERINLASLEILEKTGIEIDHPHTLDRLQETGAIVDRRAKRVKFPPDIIESYIRKLPSKVIMAARNPAKDVVLTPDGPTYARPVGGPEYLYDLHSGEYRKITISDVKDWAVLTDALENLHYSMGVYPSDVPLGVRDVYVAATLLENTEKHVQIQPYNARNIELIIEIAAAISGSKKRVTERPLVSMLISSLTPLRYRTEDVEMLMTCGKHGIPVMLNSSPISGATGPVTLVGTLALLNAEILAANTLLQSAYPGSPGVYEIRHQALDMRTALNSMGRVEVGMITAMGVQLAKKNGFIADAFIQGDAITTGVQITMEKTLQAILGGLAGANIIAGAGLLERTLSTSFIELVIDNDLMGMVFRILRGVRVDEERLAVNVIKDIGPGGHFLDSDHTLKYFKDEYYQPVLSSTESRHTWISKGSKGVVDNAREATIKILKEHTPKILNKETRREIQKILKLAAGHGF